MIKGPTKIAGMYDTKEEIMLFRQGLKKQRNLPKMVLIEYKFCGQML